MTRNADEDARDGIITADSRIGGNDWDVLFIPNTIRSISAGAYRGATNIRVIQCEDGDSPLTIYEGAFEGCVSLQVVELPGRVERIPDRSFAGCTSLDDFRIVGDSHLHFLQHGFHVFDGCPNADVFEQELDDEHKHRLQKQGRRTHSFPMNELLAQLDNKKPRQSVSDAEKSKALADVFHVVSTNSAFSFEKYCDSYSDSCTAFASIQDWHIVSDEVLSGPFYGKMARNVADLNFGEIDSNEWAGADKDVCRVLCSNLANLSQNSNAVAIVSAEREEFLKVFPGHRAAFARLVAALNPGLVVQIPAIDKIVPLYEWLTRANAPDRESANWFVISSAVRSALANLLPGRDKYQIGVFAWYLAEAFRSDLRRDEQKERRRLVVEALRNSGLL